MLKKLSVWILLAVLFAAGLNLRLAGIAAPSLHPDEPTIARWLAASAEQGEITERLYPGGFFKLALPVRALARGCAGLKARLAFHLGSTDSLAFEWDDILFARLFNVGLGLLTALLLYSLARRITGSRLAGLGAAAFCLLNPVHIEHCHYAETDVAMLFLMVLALLFWSKALDKGRTFPLLAGAFAAGFAAGTKFPLVLLVVPLLVMPFAARRPEDRWSRTWLLAGLSLALFLAAFAWTNPVVFDPARFTAGLARQSRGLQDEMNLTLGAAADSAASRILWRLRMLGEHAGDMGLLFRSLALLGLVIVLLYPHLRRKAWLLLGIPALVLALHLFGSPFIRKQEFMVYLPFTAIAASMLLIPAISAGSAFRRVIGALIVAYALLHQYTDARRVAALFRWPDPRILARNWNAVHAPADKTAAVENSAREAAAGSFARQVPLRHVADLREGIGLLDSIPADYVIRDEFAKGRGLADPFTGLYRPRPYAMWTNFQSRAILLKSWGPQPFPRANASHAGHGVGLYALDAKPSMNLKLPLPGPLLITDSSRLVGMTDDAGLGGGVAVRITETPCDVALTGTTAEVSLIADQGPAKIEVSVYGRTFIQALPPGTVAGLGISKPVWWLFHDPYAAMRVRALRGSCLLIPKRHVPLSASWLGALNQAKLPLGINGIPEAVYNDFARIRDPDLEQDPAVLSSDKIRKRDNEAVRKLKEEQLLRLGRNREKTCASPIPYQPPFYLVKGCYTLSLGLAALPCTVTDAAEPPDADRFELVDGKGRTLFEGRWANLPENVTFELTADQDGEMEIVLVSPVPRTLAIRGAELAWTLRDRLQALQQPD